MNSKEFVIKVAKYSIGTLVSAAISFLIIPIVSNYYSTDDYGKINLYYSIGNIMLYLSFLGFDSAYLRFYYEPPYGLNKKDLRRIAFFTAIGVLFLCFVAGFLLYREKISLLMFGEYKPVLLIAFVFYVLGLIAFRLVSIQTKMEGKPLLYNVQQILMVLSTRVLFVLGLLIDSGYECALLVMTVSTLLFAIVVAVLSGDKTKPQKKRVDFGCYKSLFAFSFPLMPAMVLMWVDSSVGKIILSYKNMYSDTGIISLAVTLASVFSIFASSFCVYWSSFMYSYYKEKQEFIKKVHNYVVLASAIICLMIMAAQDILFYVVNSDYNMSQKYFMIFMLAPIQVLISETTSYGITIQEKTKYNFYISGASVFINISVSLIFFDLGSVFSVSLGMAAMALFQVLTKLFIGQKLYQSITSMKKTFAGIFVIFLICFCNIRAYDSYVIRGGVILAAAVLICIIYHSELISVRKVCRETLNKRIRLKK